MRGRVLAETSGKSPKPAKQNNHHETAYAALDWDIGPDTTAGVGYLYQQRHITPDNGLPAYKNGKLLLLPQKSFTGAHWNHFEMQSHDAFADIDHYFANGAYGKIGLRYSDRDAESNYAFAGSALDDQLQVTPTGLGTNIKQKALAFDASYSQPFNWGAMRNEYVVGADYNHFKTSNEQGRARTLGAARDYRSLGSLPYSNILGNARAGSRGFAHTLDEETLDEETLDEAGVYGKLVVRPLENLSLIGGGRIGHYQIQSGDGTAKEKRNGTPLTGYAGVVWDFSKTDSLYASYSSLYRPQTAIDRNGRLLKPRRSDQIEIGHKGSYLGDRLNTRVSLYRLQDKNAAASIAGDNNHYTALGKRVMQGVELEASGALTDRWSIHAGYSYLSPKIKRAATTRDDGIFLLMPRHSANLWTTYDITVGGGVNAMSGIRSSQGVRGGGYATVDAMAAYRITPQLKLQLNVDNLFDRKYYTRVGSTNTFNIPGAERSVMATVRYEFK
nr:TonB-dependent receptor [uncultured Cardiobacterium sp.]